MDLRITPAMGATSADDHGCGTGFPARVGWSIVRGGLCEAATDEKLRKVAIRTEDMDGQPTLQEIHQ